MANLFETIRSLVAQNRYVIGQHAVERLEERGILEWQVVDAMESAAMIVERPDAQPNPTVEFRAQLPDGAMCKVVWSHLVSVDVAKLVTVHFFDR